MAVRKIEFAVGEDGALSPNTEQIGGVQGEHKATVLEFKFADELYAKWQQQLSEHKGAFVYRFDIVDGEGGEHSSDTALLDGQVVSLPLVYDITQHGGLITVELVVSHARESADEKETFVLKTVQAQVKLAFSPHVNKKEEYEDISILVQTVKNKAAQVMTALEEIREAERTLSELLGTDGNDNEFIFNGGNASGVVDADFVIDSAMSPLSCNAVENRAVKEYVDNAIEDATADFGNLHPVGSVFITSEDLTPETLQERFGGTWEKQTVQKSVCGRVTLAVTQTVNAEQSDPIEVSESDIIFDTHHITVSCISGAPQHLSVAAGYINSEEREDGAKYLKDFSIVLHRTATSPNIPVHWHVTGESYTDNNGNYHWIRIA